MPKRLHMSNAGTNLRLLSLDRNNAKNLTAQGLAVEYAKIGWPVFPCDSFKAPIVDHVLGFIHGVNNATTDLNLIAKTWHKYQDAGIGLKIPENIIVFDCDVKKDAERRPILKDGNPDIIGLKSFQNLILRFNLQDTDLNTLSVKTQSGGRHFYYRMPEGVISFNHTHALEGLDLKGYGGYVILPNSKGQYGQYEFLNLTENRPIPEGLLKWVMSFKTPGGDLKKLSIGTAKIDREEIIRTLAPYWAKADGRRNDFTLAIAGFIAHSGGTPNDAVYIVAKLSEITGKGHDHVYGAKYAFRKEGKLKGLPTLKKLMAEVAK